MSIVTLETSAIAVDRLLAKTDVVAFDVSGTFQNNALIERFKLAEAHAAPAPANLSGFRSLPAARPAPQPAFNIPTKVTPPSITLAMAEATGKPAPAKATRVAAAVESAVAPAILTPPDHWVEVAVGKGDSLAGLASQFGTSSDQISRANGLASARSLKAGQKIKIPAPGPRLQYAVQSGDTLSRISTRFGVALADLIKANDLKGNFLSEGQKLVIPARSLDQNKALAKVEPVSAPAAAPAPAALAQGSAPAAPTLTIAKVDTVKTIPAAPARPSLTIVKTPASVAAPAAVAPAPAIRPAASGLVTAKVEPRPAAAPCAPAPAVAAPAITVSQNPVRTTVVAPAVKAVAAQAVAPAPAKAAPQAAPATSVKDDEETRLVSHVVKNGDTLSTVAKTYKTSISQIVGSNQLASSNLKPGQRIQVPVSKKFYRVMQVTNRRADVSSRMSMPVRGRLNDRFGWRVHPVWRRRLFHAGVDISAPRGTPIQSAAGGVVVYAGWLSGYGKLVVVRHPNGLSTRYGHCSSLRVRKGQAVRTGQILATVGATGTATGNHLHFEVRRNGQAMNPMSFLGSR